MSSATTGTAGAIRASAVLPVKRFDAAKQRLVPTLDPDERARLAAAMLADVLTALSRCAAVEEVLLVSGEPRARELGAAAGALVVDDDDAGHSAAAINGVAVALGRGAECAALLPGDCPLLDPAELDAELRRMRPGRVAVAADRHGTGTNGVLLSPPDAIAPAFGPGSRDRHLRLAADAGLAAELAELPSLALDLDTPDDLRRLAAELGADPARAPQTSGALATLELAAAE